MPTVICDSSGGLDDAHISAYGSASDIAAIRDKTTGNFMSSAGTNLFSVHGLAFGSLYIYRCMANYDLSGNDSAGDSLSGNTVESAQIKVTTEANSTGTINITSQGETVYLCKTDGFGSSTTTADFNALDGWVSSGSYDGEVTVYGTSTEAASSELTFNLSSEAVGDINSAISAGEDWTTMLLTNADYNYLTGTGNLGSPTASGGFAQFDGVRYISREQSGSDCFILHLTYSSGTVSDNAVFFGTNF